MSSLVGLHYATVLPLAAYLLLAVVILLLAMGRDGAARKTFTASLLMIVLGWIPYIAAFLLLDYSLDEVAKNASDELSPYLRIGAAWSGGGGSLYLFSAFLSLAILLQMLLNKGLNRRAMAVFTLLVLTSMTSATLMGAFGTGPGERGGLGINPVLKNYWVVPHPTTTFLGYSFILVGSVALVLGYYRTGLPIQLLGLAFLTFGLVFGGMWSYETFGWGGYWAWDPVETSQLAVWLATVASIHMIGPLRSLNRGFAAYAASSVFLALYVTRSGVSPLHSFAAESFSAVLLLSASLVMLALSMLLFSEGVGETLEKWKSRLQDARWPPRIAEMNLSNILLTVGSVSIALSALIVYSSLLTPSVLKLVGLDTQPPSFEQGVRFYNRLLIPLALVSLYAVAGYYVSVRAGAKAAYSLFATLTVVLAIMGLATVKNTIIISPLSDTTTNLASATLLAAGSISGSVLLAMSLWMLYGMVKGKVAKSVHTLRIVLEKLVHATMIMILVSVAMSGSYAYNQGYSEEVLVPLGGEVSVMGVTISYEGYDYELHQGTVDLKNNLDPSSAILITAREALNMMDEDLSSTIREYRLASAESQSDRTLQTLLKASASNSEYRGVFTSTRGVADAAVVDVRTGENISNIQTAGETVLQLEDPTLEVTIDPKLDPETGRIEGGALSVVFYPERLVVYGIGSPVSLDPYSYLYVRFREPVEINLDDITVNMEEVVVYSTGGSSIEGVVSGQSVLFEGVAIRVVSGELSFGSMNIELPYQLDRGEFFYFMVYKGQAEVLDDILSSSISDLLESGIAGLAAGEDMDDFNVPRRAPAGVSLRLFMEVNGEPVEADLRFEANGEAIGIHGLVIDTIILRRGLTNVYITVQAPLVSGHFGEYHELMVYYLNEAMNTLRPEEYLALASVMAAGYNIASIVSSPSKERAALEVERATIDLYLLSEKLDEKRSSAAEGIVVSVKIVPGVPLLWLTGVLAGVLLLAMASIHFYLGFRQGRLIDT
ncbi:putative cytochrome C-type biogenesis protein [Aeropyrum pernix K1]|uniref:Cytochrome C-type biogenesis protein n=1 Tax=Aeropyrum pernix (strain ATCC 700893 / DSM 11879 / JCM 9820 / NBRC 100138 / K1) TaxID=272557 RepID=Q9Y9L4_AERPE|nr:heme lyase CcmF/NrfE family subunit [Aeropyrum pernix]BAA81286.1 putative cytochrome C-type biogenesis protein [Aeropyrum pernix K1]